MMVGGGRGWGWSERWRRDGRGEGGRDGMNNTPNVAIDACISGANRTV